MQYREQSKYILFSALVYCDTLDKLFPITSSRLHACASGATRCSLPRSPRAVGSFFFHDKYHARNRARLVHSRAMQSPRAHARSKSLFMAMQIQMVKSSGRKGRRATASALKHIDRLQLINAIVSFHVVQFWKNIHFFLFHHGDENDLGIELENLFSNIFRCFSSHPHNRDACRRGVHCSAPIYGTKASGLSDIPERADSMRSDARRRRRRYSLCSRWPRRAKVSCYY